MSCLRIRLRAILILFGVIYLIPIALYGAYLLWGQGHAKAGNISYILAWDVGDAERTPAGWQFSTDLGYRVALEEGYVTSYAVQALECEHAHGFAAWLRSLVSVAFAGHPAEKNPAQLSKPTVENLLSLDRLKLGTVTVNEPSYCQVHYVAAKAPPGLEQTPDEVAGSSLYLQGTYQRDAEVEPFVIRSDLVWGKVHPLQNADYDEVRALIGETLEVVLERKLDTLFDGVNFETDSEETVAKTVLRTLNDGALAVVSSGRTRPRR